MVGRGHLAVNIRFKLEVEGITQGALQFEVDDQTQIELEFKVQVELKVDVEPGVDDVELQPPTERMRE